MRAILDYRNLRQAIQWMEQGEDGAQHLSEHPGLLLLMQEMDQSQDVIEPPDPFAEGA